MLLLAAAPAIEVVEILLFQRLVDDVLVPAEWQPLVWLALLYIGLTLASPVISGVDDSLSTWISQRFLLDLRTDVSRQVLSLPQHVHERRRLGDVMSRITSDVAAVETFMIGHLAGGVRPRPWRVR
jgi:subfamily B ATP-binding cassette protein MsbA